MAAMINITTILAILQIAICVLLGYLLNKILHLARDALLDARDALYQAQRYFPIFERYGGRCAYALSVLSNKPQSSTPNPVQPNDHPAQQTPTQLQVQSCSNTNVLQEGGPQPAELEAGTAQSRPPPQQQVLANTNPQVNLNIDALQACRPDFRGTRQDLEIHDNNGILVARMARGLAVRDDGQVWAWGPVARPSLQFAPEVQLAYGFPAYGHDQDWNDNIQALLNGRAEQVPAGNSFEPSVSPSRPLGRSSRPTPFDYSTQPGQSFQPTQSIQSDHLAQPGQSSQPVQSIQSAYSPQSAYTTQRNHSQESHHSTQPSLSAQSTESHQSRSSNDTDHRDRAASSPSSSEDLKAKRRKDYEKAREKKERASNKAEDDPGERRPCSRKRHSRTHKKHPRHSRSEDRDRIY